MKLLRHGEPGREKPGLLDASGTLRDLSCVIGDVDAGTLSDDGLARLAGLDTGNLPALDASVRLGPCVGGTRMFLAIGLNYRDHAIEAGQPIRTEPILFMKASASISGPNDDVPIAPGSQKLDWEVELGVVIGADCRHVAQDRALDHVAGYCVVNDVSERSWQMERGGQWVKGKFQEVAKEEVTDAAPAAVEDDKENTPAHNACSPLRLVQKSKIPQPVMKTNNKLATMMPPSPPALEQEMASV